MHSITEKNLHLILRRTLTLKGLGAAFDPPSRFSPVRPRSNVLNISLNNTEHLLSAKCSERLTALLSFVRPC